MDLYWILITFIFGFALKQIGLPPMIGYLVAGFAMNAYGLKPIDNLETFANLGITLLLFTIGLKVRIKDITDTVVLGGSIVPMFAVTVIVALGTGLLGFVTSINLFNIDWQTAAFIGFALSFSSTVCVAKILEETGELKTRHGKVSIGILVIQDFAAVIFLVAALGTLPSVWALGLILLVPLKPYFGKLLEKTGHGELLPLVGFCFAFGAYELFYAFNLKGDLGALLMGMLLSSNAKSNELYKSLMHFKDLFLIGFFLSIGFTALPTFETVSLALALTLLMAVKFVIFFFVLVKFKLRARTSFLTAMALMNFSEFGLIVAKICVEKTWLSPQWLVAIAMSVTFSFVISSFVFKHAHTYYSRYKDKILKFESEDTINNTCPNMPTTAEILIVGMGRVGSGSYDALACEIGDKVWGIDADSDRIEKHKIHNRNVALADAEDIEFWQQVNLSQVKLIMIALPSLADMKNVIAQLKFSHYQGRIAAIAQYADDGEILLKSGAHTVFNYHKEIGAGFAKESLNLLAEQNIPEERLAQA
ncbi:cation:proton antiporter [Catenovulum sp. 2E275]|uniref:cation:proton antiporter n=1 Tax=Catenovulum sp. 2E275 TaxID=2980497 RepID=UPI0021D34AAF|nr:cation:proton antiporter family protein [Catenovulum sp. 2E275]MCU4677448.1 cation:proton antiporter [Catenovulum sp. 2E275]